MAQATFSTGSRSHLVPALATLEHPCSSGRALQGDLNYSEQYLLTCSRYIELNPVRAQMVYHPSEYPWSSYRHNALGKNNSLVVPHVLYKRLGKSPEARQNAYRVLFRTNIAEKTLDEIRAATNKAWVLGNDRFQANIEKLTARQTKPKARGGDRKSADYHKININRV